MAIQLKNQAIGNYAWMQLIRRADLDKQIKVIAFILGISADSDGSNASCELNRLADEATCTVRYAQDAVDVLELLGLIEVTRYGRTATSANVYQLTTPGGHLSAVPMRRDPKGIPLGLDGQPRTGDRPKPPALRPLLAALQGRTVPERSLRQDLTGNPVLEPDPTPPVDNPASTGTAVPLRLVTDPEPTDEYRHRGATTDPVDNSTYRQRGADVPAPRCAGTGTAVPPPNLSLLLPTNSAQATTSLEPDPPACGQPHDNPDPELAAAKATIAALPAAAARAWRRVAEDELVAESIPLTKRAVTIRTAEAATRPPPADAQGAA